MGHNALSGLNTIGNENTAVGDNALRSLASGGRNTALGSDALRQITSGSDNIAIAITSLPAEVQV